jgi:NAD(P)-dependent dehydrogenase (short-subunit alcohol dehydrogenase family)
MASSSYKMLVFGGNGSLGQAIVTAANSRNWSVVSTSRRAASPPAHGCKIQVEPFAQHPRLEALQRFGPYSAVCWAQGANLNDNVYGFDIDQHLELYKANTLFVLTTLNYLLRFDLLTKPAKMCIVSSIWQCVARQDKLSYSMTKAALQGLVLSASTDMAVDGHLLNAVLPGAVDTPMTRTHLAPEQIAKVSSATKFNRLATLEDISSIVMYLCSPENTGITGQFVTADLGFSRVHLL